MIARDNEHWNLLILLRSISESIFSKSVHKNMTTILASLIEEYLELLCELFHNPIKPKPHLLMHYPQTQRLLGLLRTTAY